jgi:hypothetical protein
MKAYWFTDQEPGGFPVERATLGSLRLMRPVDRNSFSSVN